MASSERAAISRSSQIWMPYLYRRPEAESRMRLFCFSYAGGSASAFYPWLKLFPNDIEVCPVQLPGRESRLSEPPLTSLPELLPLLGNALLPYLDRAFAFFGHSMGALISFELARYLRHEHHLHAAHLFVSGCRGPQQPHTDPTLSQLSNAAFIERISQDYHSIPRELQANAEMMELYLPMLRADYKLVETYAYQPEEPLLCPMTAFGGLQDASVSHEQLKDWVQHTRGTFALHMFPGDHFFLRGRQAELLQIVIRDLTENWYSS